MTVDIAVKLSSTLYYTVNSDLQKTICLFIEIRHAFVTLMSLETCKQSLFSLNKIDRKIMEKSLPVCSPRIVDSRCDFPN